MRLCLLFSTELRIESKFLQGTIRPLPKPSTSSPTILPDWEPTRTVAAQAHCPWDSPGENTGVASHFLLQGIFLTQGLNPGLPHYRQILCHLSHQGGPTRKEQLPSLPPPRPRPHCSELVGSEVPQPGIKLAPPTVEAQSPNHWSTREVPATSILWLHVTEIF